MKKSLGHKIRRRVSEDVASLDSWSEAIDDTSPPPVNYGTQNSVRRRSGSSRSELSSDQDKTRDKGNNMMILDPSRLVSINDSDLHVIDDDENDMMDVFYRETNRDRNSFYIENDIATEPFSSLVDESRLYSSLPETVNARSFTYGTTTQPYSLVSQGKLSNSNLRSSASNGLYSWPSAESLGSSRPHPSKHKLPSKLTNTQPLEENVDQTDRMKNKFKSFLNNMKYGWTIKTKTTFPFDSPIWMLGECYHIRPSDEDPNPGNITRRLPTIEKFKQQFCSLLWFTYRQDFPAISGTKLTSDCGWGCMLRSGQMILAKAFTIHYLGRDWNVFSEQTREQDTYRKQIIRWFGDYPCDESPFSIHKLVEVGKTLGKQPGEWYGPSSVAHIFKATMEKAYNSQIVLTDICIYVAQDCTVYKQDVYNLCCKRVRSDTQYTSSIESDSDRRDITGKWQRAVVIFIPVRLGGEELNPLYIPCIKSLLAQDSCIGIIGGKPKHSLYFVGWQEEKLIYLDPHYCQDAVDTKERNFSIQSYHCLSPRKMSVRKMDPSCTIGFYCRTQTDFEKFVQHVEEMVSPPKQKMSYPMFVFSDKSNDDVMIDEETPQKDNLLRVRHVQIDEDGRIRSSTLESEEYVILGDS